MKKQVAISRALKNVLITIVILALFSCQNNSIRDSIIDLDNAIDVSNSQYYLSSLIESHRIIQLETSSECLIGRIKKVVKVNSLLFIKSSGKELLLFDSEGNFLRKIGHKGKGPGEYIEISDFTVNENGTIVAISSNKDILFYSVNDGSFIKKQSLAYFVNSLFFLPNEELLAQVTQATFLIAHLDSEGNIINSFGSMNRAIELEQQFEFVKLNNSNYMYRIGETTDYYRYNYREKSNVMSSILSGRNILKAQELNEELEAAGPEGYLAIGDYLRNHYRIRYLKILGSSVLVSYMYKDKDCILLYNSNNHTKRNFVLRPEKSSNLIDDVLMLSSEFYSYINRANSDGNSILIYLYPEAIKRYLKDQNSNIITQSGNNESIYSLYNTLNIEDNPLIIEYVFKEI